MIYTVYKKLGETPLECLERTRAELDLPKDLSMTYVGRLDPAAEGLMIIITGDDIKDKDRYLGLDKVYEVEFIVGLSTDTGDLLGFLKDYNLKSEILELDVIQEKFNKLTGNREQRFHDFSSKVVDGKPLWLHAKEGRSASASHQIEIKRIDVINVSSISVQDILIRVQMLAKSVQGEFRQEKILESWHTLNETNANLVLIKINTHVSSGVYMRVLAEEFGELVQLPVCVYSIDRKEIII